MRLVVARREGRRGSGLGNELVPWAKGLIASQELNAHLLGPAWGLNQRRYYRNFGTSRLDFLAEDLLAGLSPHKFTEQDYFESGEVDFGLAIKSWAQQRGLMKKSSWVVTVGGLYGGYPALWNARAMIAAKLLNSRNTLGNMYRISSRLDRKKLFVAVHIRSTVGGHVHLAEGESPQGLFNICIPGSWYLSVCESLSRRFGDRIQFYVFTDRGGPDYEEAIRRFNPGQKPQSGLTECSDLLLMSQADLRICSVSSYSLVASFLADGPYLWYEPQLSLDDDFYTLWGRSPDQRRPFSLTNQSREQMRSIAPEDLDTSNFKGYPATVDGGISPGLIAQLERKLLEKSTANLLEYGAVPRLALKPQGTGKAG